MTCQWGLAVCFGKCQETKNRQTKDGLLTANRGMANGHARAVSEPPGLAVVLFMAARVSGEWAIMDVTLGPKLQRGGLIGLC